MQIGIVGAGNIGGALAVILPAAGHDVLLANSRGPESLQDLIAQLGPNVRAVTVEEAATAELVIVTIPLKAIGDLDPDQFAGRIVVDTCNYYPARDGDIAELESGALTSSQFVAKQLSQSVVVKAFNTIYFVRLREAGNPELALDERLAIPVAGDVPEARALVADLVSELGFAPIDGGTLAESRRQEPGKPVYNQPVGPAEAENLLLAAD